MSGRGCETPLQGRACAKKTLRSFLLHFHTWHIARAAVDIKIAKL